MCESIYTFFGIYTDLHIAVYVGRAYTARRRQTHAHGHADRHADRQRHVGVHVHTHRQARVHVDGRREADV